MLDAPDLTFTPTTGSGSGGNAAGNDYDECQRQLEQLAQLQQRYDTLAIDDLVARKQKELEIDPIEKPGLPRAFHKAWDPILLL
jgi:hypothetical protein